LSNEPARLLSYIVPEARFGQVGRSPQECSKAKPDEGVQPVVFDERSSREPRKKFSCNSRG
jgi:hypothetical protein